MLPARRGDLPGEDGDALAVGPDVIERQRVLAFGQDRARDVVRDRHQGQRYPDHGPPR